MKPTTHTPGPWFLDVHPDKTQAVLVDQEGFSIIYLSKPFPNDLSKDARLIAAAPDLVDALQSLVDMAATFPTELHKGHPEVLAARAAIAKARGE